MCCIYLVSGQITCTNKTFPLMLLPKTSFANSCLIPLTMQIGMLDIMSQKLFTSLLPQPSKLVYSICNSLCCFNWIYTEKCSCPRTYPQLWTNHKWRNKHRYGLELQKFLSSYTTLQTTEFQETLIMHSLL